MKGRKAGVAVLLTLFGAVDLVSEFPRSYSHGLRRVVNSREETYSPSHQKHLGTFAHVNVQEFTTLLNCIYVSFSFASSNSFSLSPLIELE